MFFNERVVIVDRGCHDNVYLMNTNIQTLEGTAAPRWQLPGENGSGILISTDFTEDPVLSTASMNKLTKPSACSLFKFRVPNIEKDKKQGKKSEIGDIFFFFHFCFFWEVDERKKKWNSGVWRACKRAFVDMNPEGFGSPVA